MLGATRNHIHFHLRDVKLPLLEGLFSVYRFDEKCHQENNLKLFINIIRFNKTQSVQKENTF